MRINRRELKAQARGIMQTARPSVIAVGSLYLILSLIFSLLSNRLMGLGISNSEAMTYMNHAMEGNYDYALSMLDRMAPPRAAYAINLLLELVRLIVNAGFIIFLLNTIRGETPVPGNLLDGFGFMPKIIWLHVVMYVRILLWSFLLFVPGIIAAYKYSQAVYILVDDPSKPVGQCLRESAEMMRGFKWDYFVLGLSFLGWHILAAMPYFGYMVQVWTLPYISLTMALYYVHLTGERRSDYPPDFDYQY